MRPLGLPQSLVGLDRPVVMGILNVTPDSFSDGGEHLSTVDAIAHGRALHEAGADIVDIGGESTRPGAVRVPLEEEAARVVPVIEALVASGVPVSIDTMRAETARAAVDAGACLVNDVSGGLADDTMLATIAELEVPCVLMHWRGHSRTMEQRAVYADVVAEVRDEILERVAAARAVGIDVQRIVIDPGLGFAKEADHNWALLRELNVLIDLGYPVLVGASRKRFLGSLLADADGDPRDVRGRDAATDAVSALAAAAGAWGVRVHDVAHARDAVLVSQAWSRGRA